MLSELLLWEDTEAREPSGQMALDEALLLTCAGPVVRAYRWAVPAVTFGYAQKYSEAVMMAGNLPVVRRWTGGGLVFHGSDLTFSLAVPASHALCRLKTPEIYLGIHRAFSQAMEPVGARLAATADCRPGPACFQSPAPNDILIGERKICGGALRRGKKGLLYQGSLHGDFSPSALAGTLAGSVGCFEPGRIVFEQMASLDREKYGTPGWTRMR